MKLSEFWGRITRRQASTGVNTVIDESTSGILGESANLLNDFLSQLSKPIKSRKERIAEYEVMAEDPIVGSAISMIAEDATQFDRTKNHVVWIESLDKKFEYEVNEWLHDRLGIDGELTDIAEQVVGKGEAFLRTYAYEVSNSLETQKAEEVGTLIPTFFEPVADISEVIAIESRGEKAGFYYESKDSDEETGILSKYEFIHFCNRKAFYAENVKLKKLGEETEKKYRVVSGQALVHSALKAYRALFTVEASLMGARIARSPFFRVLKIEIGSASKAEARRMVREVEMAIRHKETFDKSAGIYDAKNYPIPVNDFITVPTRNGKGDVSFESVGGDINIREAVDLDYYLNKLFAGLRIPKVYLGWEEALPGTLGSTSLTRLDSRYARTVKRVQKVLKSGIRDMIDFYCLVTRKPEALYEVKMAKITTAEEADISEELRGKAEIADSILRMIDSLEGVELDKVKIFKYITSKVLDVSELGDMVIKDIGVERSVEKEIQDAGEEGDGFVEPEDSEPINSEDPETIAGREARKLDTVVKMKIDECLAKKGTLDKEDIDELLRLRV